VEGLCRGAAKNGVDWEITQDTTKVISAPSLSIPATAATATHQLPSASSSSHTTTSTTKAKPRLGKLQVYPGDNAKWVSCFENTAHHVNLGLIPSSEQGWVLAVRALCPAQGGFLHVHQNVRQGEETLFEDRLMDELHRLFVVWKEQKQPWTLSVRHVECVKSFAPMVYHYERGDKNKRSNSAADEPSEEELLNAKAAAAAAANVKEEVKVEASVPKFTKTVLKKGDKSGFPRKGSNVGVFYTGYLEDGTVFDTNDNTKKKNNPLRFKVGSGRVIAGWDDAVLSMSRGEKARIVIEPEFAYGKKGVPEGKVPIPPNARLTFDVELVSFD
ncbi:FK506-binding protein 2B, partial [Actinomortierella ambigua]